MGWQAVGLATTIFIRVFNNFGVPTADMAQARQGAEVVFQQAGVNIVWVDCWTGSRQAPDAPARCTEPVGGDIVLRLAKTRETDRSKFVSMGYSLVGLSDAAPFLATVFVDRVESVARGGNIDTRRVLALAIAHEIGHVLLNDNSHAPSGLMRADWTRQTLRRNDPGSWRFLDEEAAAVRAAAMSRETAATND